MAYELLILSLVFYAINYYFGGIVQAIATAVYVMPLIIPHISDRLSRIF